MNLIFKCAKCGRYLGSYEGIGFYVSWESKSNYSLLTSKVKILCEECYWKEKEEPSKEEKP